MSERGQRPVPVALGASGMWVPAESAGELAGALALYRDLIQGRRPPAEVHLPRPTRVIDDLQQVAATVAREHQAAKHQAAARAAIAARGSIVSAPLFPAAEPPASSLPATVTVQQAADRLQLSERRVRQLAEAGRISAVRSSRRVWVLDENAVAAYKDRRARRSAHVSSRTEGTAGQP